MQAITEATRNYIHIFSGYFNQFLNWGQWLFFSLLIFNIVMMCLWYAFDRESFAESTGQFIRKFFAITFFYTLMLHHEWFIQLIDSASFMGKTLTGSFLNPSSIVGMGISIANNVWHAVNSFNILTLTSGAFLLIITYVVTIFAFINVAIRLAVVMVMTQLLVTVATFFLGFAALTSTAQIARNTLDVILANCVKLLGIYMVVGASTQVIPLIENTIASMHDNTDMYGWLLSSVLLFWALAREVPEQLSKLVSGVIQETHAPNAAAMAMTAVQVSSVAMKTAEMAYATVSGTAQEVGQMAGSTAYSAASHFKQSLTDSSPHGIGSALVHAAKKTAGDAARAAQGSLSDHFRHLSNKMTGGQGIAENASKIPGFSERMHNTASRRFEFMKASATQPKSSGRESAGSSQLRSTPPSSNV